MGMREELIEDIRISYRIIEGYEENIQLSPDPKEVERSRQEIPRQWDLIRGWLVRLSGLGGAVPDDIAELAKSLPEGPPPAGQPGPVPPEVGAPRAADGPVSCGPEEIARLLALAEPPARIWWKKAEMEMVLVPAGPFTMGSAEDAPHALADEKPAHPVFMSAYYIGRYPVTNQQYALFIDATDHRIPYVDPLEDRSAQPYNWDQEFKVSPVGNEDHPVVLVSWDDATAYCQWAGLYLPTEAEWEKAARGTDGRTYPWGNEWDPARCNWDKGGTSPVSHYSPAGDSPYGCADIIGNAWEWCADWYGRDYYRNGPPRDPPGPTTGQNRVMRGGAFLYDAWNLRCAYRDGAPPARRLVTMGFRCAISGR